ncbi:MAG: HAD-IB family phosphatase [Limisphaerales bacterium]
MARKHHRRPTSSPSRPKRLPARKVTVVIPCLNESRTIAEVVRFARADRLVGEVLVIDDGSIDGTPELAEQAGARVVTSALLGKGESMEEGWQHARHDILVYLDGDLTGLRKGLIRSLVTPLLTGEADFVKAKFTRAAGRVTILTAKPLLKTYFPELADFAQPLGGIIAARRDLLKRLRFENDYGVDIGLLIDAVRERARIVEVDIGELRHDSQSLEALGEMAMQVTRTIIERAAEWGRLRLSFVRRTHERERETRVKQGHAFKRLQQVERLALIDMDGTLLNGRFVIELARATDREELLQPLLDNAILSPVQRTRRIAALFAGVPRHVFEKVARDIPLMPGAVETVVGLRKAGYRVVIVTDSYHSAAETVRRRVFADFAVAHLMKFRRDKATGRVTFAPAMRQPMKCRKHRLCKLNVLHHLCGELNVTPEQVLAVGDSENDICVLRGAGNSVAFQPKRPAVRDAARHILEDDLRGILKLLGEPVPALPEIREMNAGETPAHG